MKKEPNKRFTIESDDKNIIIKLPVEHFKKYFLGFYQERMSDEDASDFEHSIDMYFDFVFETLQPWINIKERIINNMTDYDLNIRFQYHRPFGSQPARYEEIRARAWDFADYLVARCPDSRELSLAITKLEEVVMWANSAIARHEEENITEKDAINSSPGYAGDTPGEGGAWRF